MKNLKMLFSVAVFAAAVGGAFATNAAKHAAGLGGTVQGYIHNANNTCTASLQCNPSGTKFCTDAGGNQLWGMSGGQCVIELYRVGS